MTATTIDEVYLETELGDEAEQARTNRMNELQLQGWICTVQTLYTVWGHAVYCLHAEQPAPERPDSQRHRKQRIAVRSITPKRPVLRKP